MKIFFCSSMLMGNYLFMLHSGFFLCVPQWLDACTFFPSFSWNGYQDLFFSLLYLDFKSCRLVDHLRGRLSGNWWQEVWSGWSQRIQASRYIPELPTLEKSVASTCLGWVEMDFVILDICCHLNSLILSSSKCYKLYLFATWKIWIKF